MNIFALLGEVLLKVGARAYSRSVLAKVIGSANKLDALKRLSNFEKASNFTKGKFGGRNVFSIVKNLQKLYPKELQELTKLIKDKSKGKELMTNLDGKIQLSSSFLQYGIFMANEDDPLQGTLSLAMSGKEYEMGVVKTSLWQAMVQATGSNGTGAGSVLWNTLWYSKRTNSKKSGGVAGSLEALIKKRRTTSLQIARNQKNLKRLTMTGRQRIAKSLKSAIKRRF